jgi:hypothetical protein
MCLVVILVNMAERTYLVKVNKGGVITTHRIIVEIINNLLIKRSVLGHLSFEA